MKLKYLGTGAAEGVPGLFCSCGTCMKAAAAGGRNIRSRSQSVIDDRLLIDFPADTYMHVVRRVLDLRRINTCIVTHSHNDHLYPADFEMRRRGFAYLEKDAPLLYAHDTAYLLPETWEYLERTKPGWASSSLMTAWRWNFE